ncbi:MAG: hypothetical protein LBG75_00735 [Candidatus Nomurabacteria bacterium]|jgi:hypothetical protein|nr:hypothetical protein [Candidatus Nomurabacteria bacterium]
MNTILSFSIILLAALVHASFQLSVGCLLLLFHRNFGGKKTRARTHEYVGSFIVGAGLTIFTVLSALSFWVVSAFHSGIPASFWITEIALSVGLGLFLLLFYYRRGKHTELYLPRKLAKFLSVQIKKANNNHEAFGFGVVSVVGELPFVIIITLVGATSLAELTSFWRPIASLMYVLVAILPLVIIGFTLRSRRTISEVQKWRVHNKNFLKVMSGLCAIVLAAYLLAFKLVPLIGGY